MLECEKKQKVEECRASGKTIKVWCTEKGIAYSTYMGWSKKYFEQERGTVSSNEVTSVDWLPIQNQKDENNNQSKNDKQKSIIELCCGMWTIGIYENCDMEILKTILSLVNSLCC